MNSSSMNPNEYKKLRAGKAMNPVDNYGEERLSM